MYIIYERHSYNKYNVFLFLETWVLVIINIARIQLLIQTQETFHQPCYNSFLQQTMTLSDLRADLYRECDVRIVNAYLRVQAPPCIDTAVHHIDFEKIKIPDRDIRYIDTGVKETVYIISFPTFTQQRQGLPMFADSL